MIYRTLGRTGLSVSALALGTVSLGADYGLKAPGAFNRPREDMAIEVVRRAVACGINLVDTAPAYGAAETIVGRALTDRPDVLVATKVSVPVGADGVRLRGAALRSQLAVSLEASCKALQRDKLDVVQIHSATADVLDEGEVVGFLDGERTQGRIRFLGVSIYTEAEALAAIADPRIEVVQLAFSILDQRKARNILPAARSARMGVLGRSALLKGVLSPKGEFLPSTLKPLREAAARAQAWLAVPWSDVPRAAVRFCLDVPGLDSVLVGPRTTPELDAALDALQHPAFSPAQLEEAVALGLEDEALVNPALWPGV